MQDRINRAKELLKTVRHASMATVNADGSPHNTPFFFMYDDELQHVFWGSHPTSLHSQNVERTGQIFVALYDGNERGGLFMQANNARATEGDELIVAVTAHNAARKRFGKDAEVTAEYYQRGHQRMYMANVQKMWVNSSDKDSEGAIIRDFRYEITAADLLH